jgi:DNA-binding transcriptional ArsR family regulator
MSAGLGSLHKILKDETRRRIVLLLNEKGSVSYTDMMQALGVGSTGTLNYHLKVLTDLLTKDEAGQYVLTEKGKLASRLLLEFPERENQEQTKKKWWKRFWVVAVVLQAATLAFILGLYLSRSVSLAMAIQGVFAFVSGMVFVYFFYRMIRPPTQKQSEENPTRTIEDIHVAGQTLREVKEEVHRWIAEESITVEVVRDDFVRGRLGIPSGLGLTAPKYFEVALKPDQSGVMVHTEGWISVFDVSEKSFSKSILAYGNIPRRKGWKVFERLWLRLRAMSK